jgi:adenylosuccinate synthase
VRRSGREYGATTGRPRRCGWLDLVALRQAARLAGLTSLALTKLDVLSGLHPLRICVGYRGADGTRPSSFPSEADELEAIEPIMEEMPGFDGELSSVRRLEDLPAAARRYVDRLSDELGLPVSLLSLGPAREQTLQCLEVWSAR